MTLRAELAAIDSDEIAGTVWPAIERNSIMEATGDPAVPDHNPDPESRYLGLATMFHALRHAATEVPDRFMPSLDPESFMIGVSSVLHVLTEYAEADEARQLLTPLDAVGPAA